MKKRFLAGLLTAAFLVAGLLLGGCRPARKPAPSSPRATRQAPSPARKPAPTTPAEARRMADRVAREAAKVPGVRRATVVISGKTAFVGLDLKANVEKTRTTAIKNEVVRRVKTAEPGITTVNVTSDPDLVARLRRIADGVKKGKPVSNFASELAEISRRIAPRTS
ncbi:MAG: YhcN/YlaJ family sporulation lipoprotein [Firmicutes bacterium]|nr:YhcN/YlaJ family sporulation lipoprotein [Bacillota bacterium]